MNRFLVLSLTTATLGFVACSDSAILTPGESSGTVHSSEEPSSSKMASSSQKSSSVLTSSSSQTSQVPDSEYWNQEIDYGTFEDDRDGESYRTIKIGAQTWLAENLRFSPKVGKSWCYDRKSGSCETYGRLYDWSAAETACPEGWSLPDTTDWSALVKTAGGKVSAAVKLKAKTALWSTNKGTDVYGFSAIPGGIFDGKTYFDMGLTAVWWSANSFDATNAYSVDMLGASAAVRTSKMLKSTGIGIRCILANSASSSSSIGVSSSGRVSSSLAPSSARASSSEKVSSSVDASSSSYEPEFGTWSDLVNGGTYKTVVIGNQTWFAENLNLQHNSYAHCYDQDQENCDEYGYLYSQEGLNICPNGTHVPTNDDWVELTQFNGGSLKTQGGKLKAAGSSWEQKPGTDDYGFGAKPGGLLNGYTFSEIGKAAYFWMSTMVGFGHLYVKISGDSDEISFVVPSENSGGYFSVRCIVDPPKSSSSPE